MWARVGPITIWTTTAAISGLMWCLATQPVLAGDVSANVNFLAVNQSPWDRGAAPVLRQDKQLSAAINADLPTLNGNPVQEPAAVAANVPAVAQSGGDGRRRIY